MWISSDLKYCFSTSFLSNRKVPVFPGKGRNFFPHFSLIPVGGAAVQGSLAAAFGKTEKCILLNRGQRH